METHEFVAANTFGSEIESTFFGNSGDLRIDYLFLPQAMHTEVVSCRAHHRLGAKMQAVRGMSPRDHVSVIAVVRYAKHGVETEMVHKEGWNYDRLMLSLREGRGRA
eukprot:4362280-Pyramimonas_sp.AAC.1